MNRKTSALSERLRAGLGLPFHKRSWIWWLAWPMLFLLSLLYASILRVRRFLLSSASRRFRNANLRAQLSHVGAIVSVGNLALGGTGKTPLVRLLVRDALARGYFVLVLSRGYRAPGNARGFFQSLGQEKFGRGESLGPMVSESELCDELSELNQLMVWETVPASSCLLLGQSPHRLDLLKRVQKWLSTSGRSAQDVTVILDDGFQHLSCPRDLDILVSSWTDREAPPYCVPLGPYREGWGPSLKSLEQRAAVHVLNRAGSRVGVTGQVSFERDFQASVSHQTSVVLDYRIQFCDRDGGVLAADIFKDEVVLYSVTGIAMPERFLNSVGGLLEGHFGRSFSWNAAHLSDHSPFHLSVFESIKWDKRNGFKPPLILTMKDWCRWRGGRDFENFAEGFRIVIAVVEPFLTRMAPDGGLQEYSCGEIWRAAFQASQNHSRPSH